MIRLTGTRRERGESVVPMINVAFLLLIFFLLAAEIAPTDAIAVDLPEAAMPDATADDILIVSADGRLARGETFGDAVFEGLEGRDVRIRADARLEAAELARVLARLAVAGVSRVEVATVAR